MMPKTGLTVHFRRLYLALASSVASISFMAMRHVAFGSGIDHGLDIVSLTDPVAFGLAHQFAVRIGETGLTVRRRRDVGRLGLATTAITALPGFKFLLVTGPLVLRLGLRLGFETGASLIQLGLQRFAPGNLGGQNLRVWRALDDRRLRLGRQGRDSGGQFVPHPQHHPRMILRLAMASPIDPECFNINTLDRRRDEM